MTFEELGQYAARDYLTKVAGIFGVRTGPAVAPIAARAAAAKAPRYAVKKVPTKAPVPLKDPTFTRKPLPGKAPGKAPVQAPANTVKKPTKPTKPTDPAADESGHWGTGTLIGTGLAGVGAGALAHSVLSSPERNQQ